MQKNESVTVTIEDIGVNGEGIGRVNGYTLFIKDAIIGDVVEAKVTKAKKSYGYARLVRILKPSRYRVEPVCEFARKCGGCQIQEMSYEKQLEFKQKKVLGNLERIGGFSRELLGQAFDPIIGMEEPFRYRNKAQFPFGTDKNGNPVTGFYAGRTHDIIANTDCALGVPVNREILEIVLEFMKKYRVPSYDEKTGEGLIRHVLIRYGFHTKEIMVCFVVNRDGAGAGGTAPAGDVRQEKGSGKAEVYGAHPVHPVGGVRQEKSREIAEAYGIVHPAHSLGDVRQEKSRGKADGEGRWIPYQEILLERLSGIPGMTSITVCPNTRRTNVIMGDRYEVLWGQPFITDYIGSIRYQISPLSFYQVNPVQTEKLYGLAMEYAGLKGTETVWDLYCGIGTISLFLAQKAGQVYGVEVVPQAVEDARHNAEINGIMNAEFYVGKAEEVLPKYYAGYEEGHPGERAHADVIVVDPPRKGCDEALLRTMAEMKPERIVYVSCDSATLARDLKYLCGRGYEVKRGRAVDQFGMSVHVECVVLLSKLKSNKMKHINVELEMDELDLTAAEGKATYEEIKDYVLKQSGLKVSSLHIAQVKEKCGIIERENYNLSKSENSKQPKCPSEKEVVIREALKHFRMI